MVSELTQNHCRGCGAVITGARTHNCASRVTVEVELEYPAALDELQEPHRTGNELVMGMPWTTALPKGVSVSMIRADTVKRVEGWFTHYPAGNISFTEHRPNTKAGKLERVTVIRWPSDSEPTPDAPDRRET